MTDLKNVQSQMWNQFPITFEKNENGFWNLTAMAKPFGKTKQISNFLRSKEVKEFIAALSMHLENVDLRNGDIEDSSKRSSDLRNGDIEYGSERSSDVRNQEIKKVLLVVQGGQPELQGTWGHTFLAIRFAMWLDPMFAVWVTSVVVKLFSQGSVLASEEIPRLQEMLVEANQRESDWEKTLGVYAAQIDQLIARNDELNTELVLTQLHRDKLLYHLDSATELVCQSGWRFEPEEVED